MAGRKTKYTPETVAKIIESVSVGTPHRYAAAYAGISHETFYQWMEKKTEFSDAVKNAEARALTHRLARIVKASEETWQAAAWWAERKYPNEFGKTVQEQQHTGKDGAPLTIVFGERKDGPS